MLDVETRFTIGSTTTIHTFHEAFDFLMSIDVLSNFTTTELQLVAKGRDVLVDYGFERYEWSSIRCCIWRTY